MNWKDIQQFMLYYYYILYVLWSAIHSYTHTLMEHSSEAGAMRQLA